MPRKTSKPKTENSAATAAALRRRVKQKRPIEGDALLYSREQTSRLLNVSIATLIRLEAAGRLTGIKLTDKPTAQVFYKRDNVLVVASGR